MIRDGEPPAHTDGAARTATADPLPGVALVRREMFWIAPLGLTTIVATQYLLINPRWGADTAAILALPLGVMSIVVTILIDRGHFR